MIFSESRYPPRIKCGAGFFRIMLLVQSGHWPQRRRLLSASTETRSQKNAEIVARHGVPKLWNRLGILPIHHRCATSRGLCQRQRQRGTNCLRGISHGHGTRATNGNPVHQASKAILHSRKHKISRSNQMFNKAATESPEMKTEPADLLWMMTLSTAFPCSKSR